MKKLTDANTEAELDTVDLAYMTIPQYSLFKSQPKNQLQFPRSAYEH